MEYRKYISGDATYSLPVEPKKRTSTSIGSQQSDTAVSSKLKTVADYTTGAVTAKTTSSSEGFSRAELIGLGLGGVTTLVLAGVVRRSLDKPKPAPSSPPVLPLALGAAIVGVGALALGGGNSAASDGKGTAATKTATPAASAPRMGDSPVAEPAGEAEPADEEKAAPRAPVKAAAATEVADGVEGAIVRLLKLGNGLSDFVDVLTATPEGKPAQEQGMTGVVQPTAGAIKGEAKPKAANKQDAAKELELKELEALAGIVPGAEEA